MGHSRSSRWALMSIVALLPADPVVGLLYGERSDTFNDRSGSCSVDLRTREPAEQFDFVCDAMPGGWYHGDGVAWAPATAGSGGCHVYKFMRGAKPSCDVNSACPACEAPPGEVVKTFYLVRDGCQEPSSCEGFPAAGR
mmetsp:Transcript_126491/g.205549  ORF Transcript_126491/g.205549 Transcript_126491/m.205549 type:complete len:139 (-) Transcript_126491:107-523(-)